MPELHEEFEEPPRSVPRSVEGAIAQKEEFSREDSVLFNLEFANKTIEEGHADRVLAHLGDYPEKDRLSIVRTIISSLDEVISWDFLDVIFESLPSKDHGELANIVYEKSGSWSPVALYLGKLRNLSAWRATNLVRAGFMHAVIEHPDSFETFDQQTAEEMVKQEAVEGIAAILDNRGKFKELDLNALAREIFVSGQKGDEFILADRITEFSDLDSDVALGLLDRGWLPTIHMHIDRFVDLVPAVANAIVRTYSDESEGLAFIAEHAERFVLFLDTTKQLIQGGHMEAVLKNKDQLLAADPENIGKVERLVREHANADAADAVRKAIESNMKQVYKKLSEGRLTYFPENVTILSDFNEYGVARGLSSARSGFLMDFKGNRLNQEIQDFSAILPADDGNFIGIFWYTETRGKRGICLIDARGGKIFERPMSDSEDESWEWRDRRVKFQFKTPKGRYVYDTHGQKFSSPA